MVNKKIYKKDTYTSGPVICRILEKVESSMERAIRGQPGFV